MESFEDNRPLHVLYFLKQSTQATFEKTTNWTSNNRYSCAVMVFALLSFLPVCSFAQDPVIQPLQEDIEFGVISSNIGICRINRRGRLLGLAGQDCVGNGRSARYRVRGIRDSVINIQTAGSQIGNVRFTPRINGRTTKRLRGNGRRNIFVFGDLEILGSAAGSYSLDYVLNINYE